MKFHFSGNLIRYVDYRREIEVDGTTLKEGVDNLVRSFPDFRRVIQDTEGEIRLIHRFFLNGVHLEPGDVHCSVGPDDDVTVLTPIAGG